MVVNYNSDYWTGGGGGTGAGAIRWIWYRGMSFKSNIFNKINQGNNDGGNGYISWWNEVSMTKVKQQELPQMLMMDMLRYTWCYYWI